MRRRFLTVFFLPRAMRGDVVGWNKHNLSVLPDGQRQPGATMKFHGVVARSRDDRHNRPPVAGAALLVCHSPNSSRISLQSCN
jgi:hypothetical protein